MNKYNISIPYYKDMFDILWDFKRDNNLKYKFNIEVYNSFNNCSWNGGRINRKVSITKQQILNLNRMGISLNFNFTNHIIDINDKIGKELLQWLHESQIETGVKNKITLQNEELRKFLRSNYKFILKFSITGHNNITKNDLIDNQIPIIAYYKSLESKYDIIVPQSELVLQEWFYDIINIVKYEPIINIVAICSFCPIYKEHYMIINHANLSIGNSNIDNFKLKTLFLLNECMLDIKMTDELTGQYFCADDMKIVLNKYNRYKLEGRGEATYNAFAKITYNGIYKPMLKYMCGEDKNSKDYIKTFNYLKTQI